MIIIKYLIIIFSFRILINILESFRFQNRTYSTFKIIHIRKYLIHLIILSVDILL